jgi:hypothetical protein
MTPNLQEMTTTELKQFLSEHRNDDEAFRAALAVLIDRRDPNAPYQPYPFDLADPKTEVEAILVQKLNQVQSTFDAEQSGG